MWFPHVSTFVIHCLHTPDRYTIGAIKHFRKVAVRRLMPRFCWARCVQAAPHQVRAGLIERRAEFRQGSCTTRGTWHTKRASVCRSQSSCWPVSERLLLSGPFPLRPSMRGLPPQTGSHRPMFLPRVSPAIGAAPPRFFLRAASRYTLPHRLSAAPANARLDRVLLLLSSSSAQQTALSAALDGLQNPKSPLYHRWFSPAAYASAFANSAADVAALSEWLRVKALRSRPFPPDAVGSNSPEPLPRSSRPFTPASPFKTRLPDPASFSPATFPCPGALAPIIEGIGSLDGVISEPALTTPEPIGVKASELAAQTSLQNAPALSPQLAAQFLHLDTLHASGVRGTGQTIAIATRSNVNTADLDAFRTTFDLTASTLQVLLAGPDPGLTADQAEATLAASWASVAAPRPNSFSFPQPRLLLRTA